MKRKKIGIAVIVALSVISITSGFVNSVYATNFTMIVDANTSWGALPHFWSQCHGVGRLGLIGRDTLQRHIADARDNLGVKMIRCHAGISDAMIYSENASGTPVYTWTVCDSLYDIFVKKLKVKLLIELDWVPKALRSTDSIYGPPKDTTKWKNLVYEFVNHLKNRYGAAEIESWRFETWNEAEWFGNYGNPGPWTMQDNWKIQKLSTEGALLADSNIMIGGPGTSGYSWEKSQSGPYLTYAGQNNVRVDFLSYHAYHEFPLTVDGHFMALDTMAFYNKKYPQLHCIESSNTEYGPTYAFNLDPEPAETENGARYIADMMSQIALRCHSQNKTFPFMYSYWTVSDVFDESVLDPARAQYPFIGAMGYVSRQDLCKPVYNVFKMMNKLGTVFTSISNTPSGSINGLAAKDSSTGGVQVLVFNKDTTNSGTDNVTFAVNNINSSTGKVNYRCYLVDKTHSNAFQKWKTMGGPKMSAMSTAQWDTLRKTMVLQVVDSVDNLALTGKNFSKSYSLAKPSVMLVTLTPTSATPIIPQIIIAQADRIAIMPAGRGLRITFNAKNASNPLIRLYSSSGKLLASIAGQFLGNSMFGAVVDGNGFREPAGVYFVKCSAGSEVHTKKIIFNK